MSAAYQCLRSLSRHCSRLQRQPHFVAFEVGISGAHLSKAHHRHSTLREPQRCLHGVIILSQRATTNMNISRATYHSSRGSSGENGRAGNRSVQANSSAAAGFASNADDGDDASAWPSPASQHQQVEQEVDSPAVYRQDWQR